MKRTAIILGIAATMGVVPSVAAAGSATAQLRPQFKPQLVVQVFKPQPVSPARITIARATTYKASAYRISLFRAQSR